MPQVLQFAKVEFVPITLDGEDIEGQILGTNGKCFLDPLGTMRTRGRFFPGVLNKALGYFLENFDDDDNGGYGKDNDLPVPPGGGYQLEDPDNFGDSLPGVRPSEPETVLAD